MAQSVVDNRPYSTTDNDRINRTDEHDLPRVTVGAAVDRVRWAAILGGVFTTLATLATLTVLGVAVGLSTFDANNPDTFGIGAGVFGAFMALLAFLAGSFIAARTSAVAGAGNGLLNGAMVWIVTIVLIVNLLGNGIGTLLGITTDVATTAVGAAAEIAAPVAAEAAEQVAADPALAADAQAAAGDAAAGVEQAVTDVQEEIAAITPADVENVARDASAAAWGALLALGLTAAASLLGGFLGARTYPTDIAVSRR